MPDLMEYRIAWRERDEYRTIVNHIRQRLGSPDVEDTIKFFEEFYAEYNAMYKKIQELEAERSMGNDL